MRLLQEAQKVGRVMSRVATIDALVRRWEEGRSRGEETSVAELCHDHPELTETVEAIIAGRRAEGREETGAWAAEPIDPDVPSEYPTEDFNNGLAPAQGPDEIGRIGPFQVVQLLGSGGMGSVYR